LAPRTFEPSVRAGPSTLSAAITRLCHQPKRSMPPSFAPSIWVSGELSGYERMPRRWCSPIGCSRRSTWVWPAGLGVVDGAIARGGLIVLCRGLGAAKPGRIAGTMAAKILEEW